MKNGVPSNFTRSHISSDRVRSGYEINTVLAISVRTAWTAKQMVSLSLYQSYECTRSSKGRSGAKQWPWRLCTSSPQGSIHAFAIREEKLIANDCFAIDRLDRLNRF